MAGHSKFKKIKHKKEAADNKRSKEFSKAAKEIAVAARLGGGDPEMNPRLRMAIISAKHVNFPKTKIEEAIRKGMNPHDGENLEEVRFEGFGPSGIAVIAEAVTTSKQMLLDKVMVRKTFTKNGGTLGEEGCAQFLFQRMGLLTYPAAVRSEDDMLLLAIEHGAEDCQKVEDEYEILCNYEQLHRVKDDLEKNIGEPSCAKLIWKPNNPVILDPIKTKTVVTLLDSLVDLEIVQEVWSNLEVPKHYNLDSE